jgi:hypothetical protein
MNHAVLKRGFAAAVILATASTAVLAQEAAAPTYQADPEVYKVIFEDSNFRVIEANRKAGVHDKTHGHPVPGVIYFVTDCHDRLYDADGKTSESATKAGTARAVPVIASHSAENIGPADCKVIIVEKK